MGLESIVGGVANTFSQVKDWILVPDNVNKMVDYAKRYYLNKETQEHLATLSPAEKENLYSRLKYHIEEAVKYQQKNLDSLMLKVGRGAGLASVLNETYSIIKGIPFSNWGYLQAALVGSKGLLELPTMYKHLVETADLYGTVEWLASKAVAWFVPVAGPALDYNVARRVITRNAIWRGASEFMKEIKKYTPQPALPDQLYERVKTIAGPTLREQYA